MAKSADAFRTISEVADWLETPAHVLRFWESKFSQVKPVKRAGGRRYYRPADMKLLGGIKKLLHDDGMTIKGVQKMLREQGVAHVSDFSQPLGDAADDVVIDHVEDTPTTPPEPPDRTIAPPEAATSGDSTPVEPVRPAPPSSTPAAPVSSASVTPEQASPRMTAEAEPSALPAEPNADEPQVKSPDPEIGETPLTFSRHKPESTPEPEVDDTKSEREPESPPLPSFLKRRDAPPDKTKDPQVSTDATEEDPAPVEPPSPRPITVDVPDDPSDDVTVEPSVLTQLSRLRRPLSPDKVSAVETLVSKLRAATGSATRD